MWKLAVNFISLHYAYIITLGILGIVVLYPYGNLKAIDAYLFGVSSSTESGLNPVDLKELKIYQQLFLYFVPIVSNPGFVNVLVVIVRLYWFEKHLKTLAPTILRSSCEKDEESHPKTNLEKPKVEGDDDRKEREQNTKVDGPEDSNTVRKHISFADESRALYIPSPRERDRGHPITEVDSHRNHRCTDGEPKAESIRQINAISSTPTPLQRVASTMFVLGAYPSRSQERHFRKTVSLSKDPELPGLSSQASLGRNSQFYNLTTEDRERLGGIEYRSLKLLLKISLGYFVGLHVLGVICLVPWIQYADPRYREYLEECGQGKIWWAFYTAQTMVDNLGFSLTPDSMVSFRDAAWPMFVMSFLAYAGHTMYPCFLRLIIWVTYKLVPQDSSLREPLSFLLNYPRRCFTLLFRSRPTWVLFGILFVFNLVDVLLIIVLDLHNPTVNTLPGGQRVLAAIFQAASSRHTGTSSFNLADVNPAVQFSLLVMMYISIFPIAISIRASNTYEESALGMYPSENEMDENHGVNYVIAHMRNQLSFDLWYIFLGIFCVCATEAHRIMDPAEPAFNVFAVFFEVVSAYGNVGLSLGYPGVSTSFCGQFSVFSKVVLCAMMIRGRHRGLPVQLDRAIMLPGEKPVGDERVGVRSLSSDDLPMILNSFRRYHTK